MKTVGSDCDIEEIITTSEKFYLELYGKLGKKAEQVQQVMGPGNASGICS